MLTISFKNSDILAHGFTGILFSRDNLEKFKKLLGKRYEITTDKDLADLAAEKGDDLLKEVVEAAKGGDK